MSTVLGWILNPALSSEKYFIFPPLFLPEDILYLTNFYINPFTFYNIHVLKLLSYSLNFQFQVILTFYFIFFHTFFTIFVHSADSIFGALTEMQTYCRFLDRIILNYWIIFKTVSLEIMSRAFLTILAAFFCSVLGYFNYQANAQAL